MIFMLPSKDNCSIIDVKNPEMYDNLPYLNLHY